MHATYNPLIVAYKYNITLIQIKIFITIHILFPTEKTNF